MLVSNVNGGVHCSASSASGTALVVFMCVIIREGVIVLSRLTYLLLCVDGRSLLTDYMLFTLHVFAFVIIIIIIISMPL